MKSKMCRCTVKTKSTKLILGLSREDEDSQSRFSCWYKGDLVKKYRGENTHEETAQKQNSEDVMREMPRTRSCGEGWKSGGEEGRRADWRAGLNCSEKGLGSPPMGDPWMGEWDLGGFTWQWRTEKTGRIKEWMGEGPPRHHWGVQPFYDGDH